MNNSKKFTLEDLKSGMVVKLKNDKRFLVIRAGRFTKILTDGFDTWYYLSEWDNENLKCKSLIVDQKRGGFFHHTQRQESHDIMEVYGLINDSKHYQDALCTSIEHRELLWSRKKPPVKMTVAEICEKLGYDVEIVKEK